MVVDNKNHIFSPPILSGHIAFVGMTGAGKTSTSKLAVEQGYDAGEHVCIIDPIKSDWHGIISNATGKGPGLPFTILGGPYGHVPLHPNAGTAIAEAVATGALRYSILDTRQFPMGGLLQFWNAFAPVLLDRLNVVLRLVLEEAHELAPKEKAGVGGGENLATYHAKKLATAGRSAGLRLQMNTQRVQSLHNSLLGSCSTVVVHRMNLPADQKPVIEWLQGSISDKTARAEIEASIPKLKTGEGWICSGMNDVLERMHFPRIRTYDNSAAPTKHGQRGAQIFSAAVDTEQLRKLIGHAAEEADNNDVKKLRARIKELQAAGPVAKDNGKTHTNTDIVEARRTGDRDGYARGIELGENVRRSTVEQIRNRFEQLVEAFRNDLTEALSLIKAPVDSPVETGKEPAAGGGHTRSMRNPKAPTHAAAATVRSSGAASSSSLSAAARKVLAILSQFKEGCVAGKITLLTRYRYTGTFRNALSELRSAGFITGDNGGVMLITEAGMKQGPFPALPRGKELLQYWLAQPNFSGAARKILTELQAGEHLSAEDLCERTGYEYTGTFRNALSELRTAGVIVGKNTERMRISREIVP